MWVVTNDRPTFPVTRPWHYVADSFVAVVYGFIAGRTNSYNVNYSVHALCIFPSEFNTRFQHINWDWQ